MHGLSRWDARRGRHAAGASGGDAGPGDAGPGDAGPRETGPGGGQVTEGGSGPTSLSAAEREILAAIRDDLEAGDPASANAFRRMGPRSPWRWWLGAATCIAAMVALLSLGPVGLGVVVILPALAAPLAVAAAVAAPGRARKPRRRPR